MRHYLGRFPARSSRLKAPPPVPAPVPLPILLAAELCCELCKTQVQLKVKSHHLKMTFYWLLQEKPVNKRAM